MKKAVALSYSPDLPAPIVLASGRAGLAAAIERVARDHDIPVASEPLLAEALVDIDVGGLIPSEHYRLVAEILVFVSTLGEYELPSEPQAADPSLEA